jgi:hypothetical protein
MVISLLTCMLSRQPDYFFRADIALRPTPPSYSAASHLALFSETAHDEGPRFWWNMHGDNVFMQVESHTRHVCRVVYRHATINACGEEGLQLGIF